MKMIIFKFLPKTLMKMSLEILFYCITKFYIPFLLKNFTLSFIDYCHIKNNKTKPDLNMVGFSSARITMKKVSLILLYLYHFTKTKSFTGCYK